MEYLVLFFRNLLLGENNELRNRYLHIRWEKEKPQNEASGVLKPHFEVSGTMPAGLSLKEIAVLKLIIADTSVSIARLSENTGLSTGTIDRIIKSLKGKGLLSRVGSTKHVKWIVTTNRQQNFT